MLKHHITENIIKEKIVNVTDRGANVIKSMKSFERINDAVHLLNTLAKRMTTPYKENYLPETYEISLQDRAELLVMSKIIKHAKKVISGIK